MIANFVAFVRLVVDLEVNYEEYKNSFNWVVLSVDGGRYIELQSFFVYMLKRKRKKNCQLKIKTMINRQQ